MRGVMTGEYGGVMTTEPYKVRHIMQYSEYVYYDGSGTEVFRARVYDDHLYDTEPPERLEDWELSEYIGGDAG